MEAINSLLTHPPQLPLGFNLFDIIIILVVWFYAYEGYSVGFFLALLDLASFISSFIIALKFYGVMAKLLMTLFSLPIGFANAIGFFVIAFIAEIVINLVLRR